MIKPVRIGQNLIGPGHKCFIVAEAGVNHNGNIETAYKLMDAAVSSSADAIKFQIFNTEDLVTKQAEKARYQVNSTGEKTGQYDMLKALELSTNDHINLLDYAKETGILYICTPYDKKSLDFLISVNVDVIKIASTDVTNIPFLRYIASKKVPVILSTGLSTLGEIEAAYNTLYSNGIKDKIIILHCTSEYPTLFNEVNLKAMITLQYAFNCPIGFSDHTEGIGASPWASTLGASLIEKHFTLNKMDNGPDHKASIEPDELSMLVKTIRDVESALGDGVVKPTKSEMNNKPYMQKSLVANKDIKKGKIIIESDIAVKRPATGLQPSWFELVIGKKAAENIDEGETLTLAHIDWN